MHVHELLNLHKFYFHVIMNQHISSFLLDEVQNLYESGIDENYQAMKGIGYKEFIPYFKGESSLEECVELVKQHTRNYAKRQLTWFRRMDYITWFEPTEHEKIIDYIKRKMYENNN